MKTFSLLTASVVRTPKPAHGLANPFQPLLQALARLYRRNANAFPAIALAEAGDTEGAEELLNKSADKDG